MSKSKGAKQTAQQPKGGPPQSQIKRADSNRAVLRQTAQPMNRKPTQSGPSLALLAGGVVILVLMVGAIFVFIFPPGPTSSGGSTGSNIGAGVVAYPNLPRTHQDGTISYVQNPPVGGNHNAQWQNCGVYDKPIRNENGVHTLEHGAVWITYQPNLPADEVNTLRGITQQSGYRLLSPYPGLPSPIVASAWGYQLKLDTPDYTRLMNFIQKYEQKGPEPGAACTGGVGQPVGS
jgi:Protein of unknown function (DUF3105)